MLATILIWAYTLVVTMLYGWALLRVLQRLLKRGAVEMPAFPVLWLVGLAELTTLTSLLSLVVRVNFEVSMLVTAGAVIIAWFFWKENQPPQIQFSQSKDVVKVAAWLLVVVCLATVLENATHKPANPDTGIYHAQAIRWIETYPAVPGLGNLHTRLAFNSSWLVTNALFSFVYLDICSFHLLGSVFFVVFLGYLFEGLFRFVSCDAQLNDILRLFLIPVSFWVFASEISSPGTDLPAALLIWFILLEFLRFLEMDGEAYPLQAEILFGLSVFAVTVKLSSAPIVLIGVYLLWWKFKRNGFKGLLAMAGIGALVLLPWLARNVVLSGYLVYPRPELDLFNVDWKIPQKIAAAEQETIMAWARISGLETREVLRMPLAEWTGVWFSKLSRNRKAMLGVAVAAPVVYFLAAVLFRKAARPVIRVVSSCAYAFVVVYAGLVFWFFTAPDFRFGYAFIISALVMAVLPAVAALRQVLDFRKSIVVGWVVVSLLIYQVTVLGRSVEMDTLRERVVLPRDYVALTTAPCKIRNLTLWCAEAYNECWYDPFPCVPSADPLVEMRGDSLRDGFRSIGLNP